jgi:hypothetical protein
LGSIASRAGDRHPLLLAARELCRVGIGLVGEPDPVEQLAGLPDRRVAKRSPDPRRRLDDVLQGRHVREEVEALEDHPDLRALAGDLALAQLVELVALLAIADEPPVDPQAARVDLLEVVDAAQERRLPRAGRPEHAHDLARRDLQRDAAQDLEPAEALVDGLGLDHRRRHGSISPRRAPR